MNYLTEINAFNRWTEFNYLSPNAQLLWFKIIDLFNKSMWREQLNISNERLMSMMYISDKRTFEKAKSELIQNNLIVVQQLKRGHLNTYKLISLANNDANANDDAKNVANNAQEMSQKMCKKCTPNNINNKQLNNKYINNNNIYVQSSDFEQGENLTVETADGTNETFVDHSTTPAKGELFERFWRVYPVKKNKKKARLIFEKLNVTEELLEKMLTTLGFQRRSPLWEDTQYIPLPTTWLNNARWEDEMTFDEALKGKFLTKYAKMQLEEISKRDKKADEELKKRMKEAWERKED